MHQEQYDDIKKQLEQINEKLDTLCLAVPNEK